jgi:hypothetical protein
LKTKGMKRAFFAAKAVIVQQIQLLTEHRRDSKTA